MAFQSVPESVEISINCTVNSIPVQNTYHARKVGGYSQADLDSLAGVVDQVVVDDFRPLWATAVTYNTTDVRGLESEVDLTATDGSGTGAGAVAQIPMPNNVSFAIKKLSGFTGRSARGRVYIFGIPASDLDTDENFMKSASLAAWQSAVDAVKDAIDLDLWVPVIVSRFNAGAKRAEGVTFEWTTTSAGNARLDSRRDRMPQE